MTRPNLFKFATSELSQDAFLCWLLEWADSKYKETDTTLHSLGKSFIHAIFEKHERLIEEIHCVEIIRQLDGLDILAVINDNDDLAILIEDKTYTSDHSNQLIRYREAMDGRGYTYDNQLPIYYKISNQGSYKSVNLAGYKLFHRTDMLKILEKGIELGIHDSIFIDYYKHLFAIEAEHNSYLTQPLKDWEWFSWHGFYTRLQEESIQGNWDYVANQKGGFVGFWWHWKGDENCKQYLQLEQTKLCVKIRVENHEDRARLRTCWSKKILENCEKHDLAFRKPDRFGNGLYMTVAVLDNYIETDETGMVDMGKTVMKLKRAEELLNSLTYVVV